MKNYSAKNVGEYIASAPKEARTKLREVRAAVRSTVPKAEEGISWGVPFYKYRGLLAGFAANKNHILFGLAFALQNSDRNMLKKKGYVTGKKTVRIKFDQKVPMVTIRKMLEPISKLSQSAIVAGCRKAEAQGRRRTRGYDDSRGNEGNCGNQPDPLGGRVAALPSDRGVASGKP